MASKSNLIIRDLSKRFLAQVGGSGEPPFFSNQHQQQWRAYAAQSFHRLKKPRGAASKFSNPLFSASPSLSFSSSTSKTGFVGWYLGVLESRPLLTKSISSSLIYAAADFTSQLHRFMNIQLITSPASGSYDSIRTLRMAAYGLLILGPSQHLWFNFVSEVFPKRDLLTTLKKIFMGQAIYGPCITSVFFSYNAALQGESGGEIVARLKRDLLPTLINGAMFWPVCDFVTFKFVPVHLQPLMNSSCAYLWTIYLTYMASLKKVGVDFESQ